MSIRKYQTNAQRQAAYRERKSRELRNKEALQNGGSQRVNVARPPVRYFGGKWRIANWIMQYSPPHYAYVEPFCGGANLLFRKEPSPIEIINDLNGDVINFFDVLRAWPDELIRAIRLTPYAREEHRRAHDRTGDQLERARKFYIRSRQSYGSGEGEYNTGWRFQIDDRRGSSLIDEWNDVDFLYQAAMRLKGVQIECDDAIKVIQRFDSPETFFYVDPPYLFETRYSDEERYAVEMTNQDHRQLAEVLHGVQGKVILSGYDSDLYRELYPDWWTTSKASKTNGNFTAEEFLWVSPNARKIEDLPLFQNVI